MCGIAGVINLNNELEKDNSKVLRLIKSLKERGPDASGIWHSPSDYLTLGHTRLSILDLSENGNQPMISRTGRYSISYNGEIYNHRKLKNQYLGDQAFRGSSDTEIILNLFERFGVKKSIKLLEGMFAFFVFDHVKKIFHICRDRIGEKPVCYFYENKQLIFCSEVRALAEVIPSNKREIDEDSIRTFLNYGFIPAPSSLFKRIKKLKPGYILEGSLLDHNISLRTIPYWSVEEDYLSPIIERSESSRNLEECLKEVISEQLITDRPLGAFLSGGIDSSLICSLAKEIQPQIDTFSMGYEDESFSELKKSRLVAETLGTNHTEIIFREKDILEVIPVIPKTYDEPFADQSQIPTLLLTKLAREAGNIVCLTGDGGDELFGGYNRHRNIKLFLTFKLFFKALNNLGLRELKVRGLNRYIDDYFRWLNLCLRSSNHPELLDIYFSFLNRSDSTAPHFSLLSENFELESEINDIDIRQQIMMFDLKHYISNDVLVKTDRASMYYGLELRAPFLHPKIVRFSASLSIKEKITRRKTKKILKDILARHLPKEIIQQPKRGFDVPLAKWLRNDLKDWVHDIRTSEPPNCLIPYEEHYFEKIECHLKGKANYTNHIWPYLMIKSWFMESPL